MRKSKFGGMVLWLVLIVLVIVPLYQFWGLVHAGGGKTNAKFLLYQVSLFQMELLYNQLNQSAQAKDTAQLDALKQDVYAMNYTHERLVLAFGGSKINQLDSLSKLMQYIERLQIGGRRALKPEEISLLQQITQDFKPVYTAYDKLISTNVKVNASQNSTMMKQDQKISSFINQKLLN